VAVHAHDCLVRPIQIEISSSIVVESGFCPRFAGVAVTTFGPAMAIMVVVLEMATDTPQIHNVVKRVFAVTVTTGKHGVLTFQ